MATLPPRSHASRLIAYLRSLPPGTNVRLSDAAAYLGAGKHLLSSCTTALAEGFIKVDRTDPRRVLLSLGDREPEPAPSSDPLLEVRQLVVNASTAPALRITAPPSVFHLAGGHP